MSKLLKLAEKLNKKYNNDNNDLYLNLLEKLYSSEKLSEDEMLKLINSDNFFVYEEMIKSPNITKSDLYYILDMGNKNGVKALAESNRTPQDILYQISQSNDSEILSSLASNKNIDTQIIEKLLKKPKHVLYYGSTLKELYYNSSVSANYKNIILKLIDLKA